MYSILAKSILTTLALEWHRRVFLSVTSSSFVSTLSSDTSPSSTSAQEQPNDLWYNDDSITVPLEKCSGGRYCLRITVSYDPVVSRLDQSLSYVPYKVFKLAIDTGSPYLVISDGSEFASFVNDIDSNIQYSFNFLSSVSRKLAFLDREISFVLADSGYQPTIDIYGSQSGIISWKQSMIQISKSNILTNIVLGVLDPQLAEESGGSLFGLVKNQNKAPTEKVQPRPTLLDQLGFENKTISSFQIDGPGKLLTLSRKSMIPKNARNVIHLFDMRPLGDFVDHYAMEVKELKLNDISFTSDSIYNDIGSKIKRKIVAVVDTGLTGCLLTSTLWKDLSLNGVSFKNIESITVSTHTTSKATYQFNTSRIDNPYFYVRPIDLDWFTDEETCPYVVVLGQTFLYDDVLTIDIDERKLCFEPNSNFSFT